MDGVPECETERQARFLAAVKAMEVRVAAVPGSTRPLLDAKGLDQVADTLRVPGRTTRFMSVAAVRKCGMEVRGAFDNDCGVPDGRPQTVRSVPYGSEVVACEVAKSTPVTKTSVPYITAGAVDAAAAVANYAAGRAHAFWSVALITSAFDGLLAILRSQYGVVLGVRVEVPAVDAAEVDFMASTDPPVAYVPFSVAAAERRLAGLNVCACVRLVRKSKTLLHKRVSTKLMQDTLRGLAECCGVARTTNTDTALSTVPRLACCKPKDGDYDDCCSSDDSDAVHMDKAWMSSKPRTKFKSKSESKSKSDCKQTRRRRKHRSPVTCDADACADADADDGDGAVPALPPGASAVDACAQPKHCLAADVCMVRECLSGTAAPPPCVMLVTADADTDECPTFALGGSVYRQWLAREHKTMAAASKRDSNDTRLGCFGFINMVGCGIACADAYGAAATRLLYEVFQANPRVRDWATVVKALNDRACAYAVTVQPPHSGGSMWDACHPAAGGAKTGTGGKPADAVTVQQPVIYIVNGEGDAVAVPTDGNAGLTDLGNGVKIQCSGSSGANTCSFGGHAGAGAGSGATVTAQMPAIYIVNNGGGNNGSHTAPAPALADSSASSGTSTSLDFLLYSADYILRKALTENPERIAEYEKQAAPYGTKLARDINDRTAARGWLDVLQLFDAEVKNDLFTQLLVFIDEESWFDPDTIV